MRPEAHVALAVDGDYVEAGAVAVATLVRHFDHDGQLTVWVLHAGMRDNQRELYRSAVSLAPRTTDLRFARLPASLLDHPVESHYISSATFGRLALARLLSKSATRILYLDADIMVRGDLSELFSLDLHGAVAGAVREPSDPFFWSRNGLEHVFRLGVDPWQPYFNAGVLVLDAARMRAARVEERCLEYMAAHRPLRMDQDALNAVLIGEILELPTQWNVEDYYFKSRPRRSRYRTILDAARVLHFVGDRKPWNDPRVWLSAEWEAELGALRVHAGQPT
jgi:lipopolysaccharide biosynthesis glycosyltransferase